MIVLSLRNLVKTFGGLVAVASASFDVEDGSIVGLIGPNGAGKTTIFNLITGNLTPDAGEIFFTNHSIKGLAPHRIVANGIARTFQTIRLFENMTVLENVLAGRHCRMRAGMLSSLLRLPRQRREEKLALKHCLEELDFVGMVDQRQNLARNLAYGSQRLLEIARALATEPRLLILDEPAGGMNEQETGSLIDLIRAIQARGISILLIEHDMSLVMEVCKKLVVLEYGGVIAAGPPEVIKNDPKVIEAYLGQDLDDL
ncbi:MAG: ABC transporter ATP-binding protein [Desulfarculales bacterium]|jgi:branched-chain amino acid transport system ATP-binding protein|nr:ABC transporter ATP-binding protein [Desulfarculales bacterium]